MSEKQIYISVGLMIVATMLTRALPFLLFGNRPTPKVIVFFGKALPCAAVALLVVYCLRSITFSSLAGFLPMIIAAAVTALLHWWKGNTLLSIGVGTALYMILVQFVFV